MDSHKNNRNNMHNVFYNVPWIKMIILATEVNSPLDGSLYFSRVTFDYSPILAKVRL